MASTKIQAVVIRKQQVRKKDRRRGVMYEKFQKSKRLIDDSESAEK